LEPDIKAMVVKLVLEGRTEKALNLLAEHYRVNVPNVRVGLPSGHLKKTNGCYSTKNITISVLNSDLLRDPFVILHEFYHHLRTTSNTRLKHKGTEKNANKFAEEFIRAYRTKASKKRRQK
jgi:hypothetical protein